MKLYRICFEHAAHDDLDEGRLMHEGSVYMVDKNNDVFWVVSEGDSLLQVELFGQGALVVEKRLSLTKWCTLSRYESGITAEEDELKLPVLLCDKCEPVDDEDELREETTCGRRSALDINVVKGGGLPPAWPSGRRPSRNTSNRWRVLIHHMMRGDMYTFGAALVLDPDFSVEMIRPHSSLDSTKFPDHTGRHRAWFQAMLGDSYRDGVHNRWTKNEYASEWESLNKRHKELTDEYWNERSKHLSKLDKADLDYQEAVRKERARVPKGKMNEFLAWKETEYQRLSSWKASERMTYESLTRDRLWKRKKLNVPEDVDRYHYKCIVKQLGRGYNFPGTVTNYVGTRFAEDSKGARRRVRDAFVKVSGGVAGELEAYAKKNLRGVLGLSEDDVCVIFFIRNVKPRSEEDKDWNLNRDAYWDLVSLFSRELRPKNGTLRIVAAGDSIERGCKAEPDNLVQLWTRKPFNTPYEHAEFPDMRIQLALYDYLLQQSKCRFVVVGMRSGMLEPLAILGFPVVYLEKKKDDMGRNLRMRQWNGRIPYFATYIDEFPRVAKFSSADLVRIRRRMLEALAYGSDHSSIADEDFVEYREGHTILLHREGRFATYDALYYEGSEPRNGPFMAVASVSGKGSVKTKDAHQLRDATADYIGGKGTPKRVSASKLGVYVRAYGHDDSDDGPEFDDKCEDAMLHALACSTKCTIVTYAPKDDGIILVPDMVHNPGQGRIVLLFWAKKYGYCPLVPAATRRGLDLVTHRDDPHEEDLASESEHSDDEDEDEIAVVHVCDICGTGSDIVSSQCTKQGPGCTGAFYMGRASACQARYFSERNGSGDGNNRCKVCLLADGVLPARLANVGPCP